jgi:hypothetical protein
MSWDRISNTWRETLVNKLRERYGLGEEEAGQKADAWLMWISEEPRAQHLAKEPQPRRTTLKSRAAKRS